MTVRVLFFAQARDLAGSATTVLDLPDGSRVADALELLRARHPGLAAILPHLAVAVNRRVARPDDPLPAEAELALLPPVSGGAPRASKSAAADFRVEPATAERWGDLVRLFGPRGACAGCWCQWARWPAADYEAGKGDTNRRRLRRQAGSDTPPGLIGYLGDTPVAWCSIGPREHFRRLERSPTLAPVDDAPVWSITCFFVDRAHRGRGLSVRLLEGAAVYASRRGATLLEGYPLDTAKPVAPVFAWWGVAAAFRAAGFTEVARRAPTRPIVRRRLAARRATAGAGAARRSRRG